MKGRAAVGGRWEFSLRDRSAAPQSHYLPTTAKTNIPGSWAPLTPEIEIKTVTGSLAVVGLIPKISGLATVKLIYLFNLVLDLVLMGGKKKEGNFIATFKEIMLSGIFKLYLKQ